MSEQTGSAPAGSAPLVLEGVSHAFGDVPVLNGVGLEVERGELLAILGPSGCGKTTLLRSVAGLTTPAAGTIAVGGRTVCADGREHVPTEARGVGLVFQSYALFGHMSVADNVAFGLRAADPQRVQALLELTGLGALGQRRPSELSGGQQQRVALARALAPRPHVLLLDEPFANVDAALRADLTRELRRMLAEEGTTALLVTHDREDALRAADRVAVFVPESQGGVLAQCASPEAVYERPASLVVGRLTGTASVLPGRAAGARVESGLGTLDLREPREGRVDVVLRPERLAIEPDPEGPLRVQACSYVGRAYRVTCALDDVTLIGESAQRLTVGASARGRVDGPVWGIPAS